jgi:hypothetical protein
MSSEFDLDKLAEIPDPLGDLASAPVPPRRAEISVRPPTRESVVRRRAMALVGAIACQGFWLALFHKRADLATVSRSTLAAEVGFPLVAAAIAFGAATAPGPRGLGESRERLAPWALLSPAVFVAATLLSSAGGADSEPFTWHAARCFLVVSLFAVGPAILAGWAFRRSFAAAAGWRAAALGIACAALAAASMGVVCSTGSAAHVLVGHGGVIFVAGAAGALLGSRYARS